MSLQNLQADFIDSILSGDGLFPAHPENNMQIHANNIESNMISALTSAYPMIHQILGNTFFTLAAKEYVDSYPSRSPDLHEYGEYFDSFIAEFEPARDFVYLSEVARFEWTCHEIYFAPEHGSFDSKALATIDEADFEKLHFVINPACRVQRFMYPILDIVDLCKYKNDENVDLDKGGINLMIARYGVEIKLQPLADAEFVCLTHLQDNMPLSVALEEALAVDADFDLKSTLPRWINERIIVDCLVVNDD